MRGRMQADAVCDALLAEAGALGLTGWMQACTDGSVEAVLQGDAEVLAHAIEWATRGPSDALVTSVEVDDAPGEFTSLELRA